MIGLSIDQLQALLASIGWPFVRILAFISTEPVLGNRSVPFRVKIGVSLLIALLVAPAVSTPASIEVVSGFGLLILAQQILVGVAMGFTARIVIAAAEMAGQMAGLQMGLGFAVFFDPDNSGQVPVVAQFYGLIATLTLLATNGHHLILQALAESFRVLPITAEPLSAVGFRTVVYWGTKIFEMGVMMSLPIVGALLVANVGLGILTRAAPQLNIFAVGFPVTLSLGFLMLYFSLPLIVPMIDSLAQEGIAVIMRILAQLKP